MISNEQRLHFIDYFDALHRCINNKFGNIISKSDINSWKHLRCINNVQHSPIHYYNAIDLDIHVVYNYERNPNMFMAHAIAIAWLNMYEVIKHTRDEIRYWKHILHIL